MPTLRDLSSPGWRERKRAILELARSGDPALVPALLDILRAGHTDLNALNAALQIISELGEQVTPALVDLLEDAETETRMYAALALGSLCDQRSQPALIEALADQNPNVRFQAIDALANLRAQAAIPRLVEIAKGEDEYLAFAAVSALGEIGDPQTLPELLPLLHHEVVSTAAAPALGKLGDTRALAPLADWLRSPTGEAAGAAQAFASFLETAPGAMAAARLQEQLQPADLQRLLEALPERPRPVEQIPSSAPPCAQVEMDLAHALARIFSSLLALADEQPGSGPPAWREILVDGLLKLLRHSSGRPLALAALGKARPFALDSLAPLCNDDDPVVRRAAGVLLAQHSGPADLGLLLSALQGEDEEVAALAASGLGRVKAPESFTPLLESLTGRGAQLRLAALEALFKLEHSGFPAAMIDLLDSADIDLRQAGLYGLRLTLEQMTATGSQPAAELVEAVLTACSDPAPSVRCFAIEALGFCRGPEVESALAAEAAAVGPSQRAAVARALGHAPAGFALPLLYTLLQDSDPWVRVSAVRSFVRHADPESLAALEGLVADSFPPVRVALAQAASKWIDAPGERSRRILQTLEQDGDPDVRQAAMAGRLPPPPSVGSLG